MSSPDISPKNWTVDVASRLPLPKMSAQLNYNSQWPDGLGHDLFEEFLVFIVMWIIKDEL